MKVLRGDPAFAAALDARQLETYQPIPSLALNELPNGRIERRIAVGLLPRGGDAQHEIVAVDLVRRRVIHFEQAINDHDVVIWYGGHFTHDVNREGPAQHGHIVGPDLKPVNW
ncbi:MAG: hypothetical protein H8K07_07445 [Nitrospira sp.]|nr:hypothetical protein [Nitrospira sp.]